MSWIKRNLSLVLSGVITLALLGFGSWYLWSAMQSNKDVDDNINRTKSEIERLLGMDPSPSQSNLNNAKRELDRLNAFIAGAKKQFPPSPPLTEPLNDQSFKSLLAKTVDELHRQAVSVDIKMDSNYYFSFDAQRLPFAFPPESLRPLSERLHEVRTIVSILLKARINRLESVRRSVVAGEKVSGTDYLNVTSRTNAETGLVLWPYELTFQCFSAELSSALEDLERAPYGFLVKSPVVEPAEDKAPAPGAPPVRPPPGRGGARTNAPAGLETIINEKMLRVTLRIEVIKPLR